MVKRTGADGNVHDATHFVVVGTPYGARTGEGVRNGEWGVGTRSSKLRGRSVGCVGFRMNGCSSGSNLEV